MILSLKTDQPEVEYGLDEDVLIVEDGRQLSKRILKDIEDILGKHNAKKQDISGIVVFKGPGSFTGLRIGHTIANTLAYSLQIPIVSTEGANWRQDGIEKIKAGEDEKITKPIYGGKVNITKPKK